MAALIRDDANETNLPSRIVAAARRDLPLVAMDLVIVPVAYLVAVVLRFDGSIPDGYWASFRVFALVAMAIFVIVNYLFGLYGEMWRFASVQEARRVLMAGAVSFVIVMGVGWRWPRGLSIPLSVLVAGSVLALAGIGAVRFQSRLFGFRRRGVDANIHHRVIVVGAGEAAAMVLGDLLQRQAPDWRPVGIVDDDARKRGLSLHGVRVLGTLAAIPALVGRLDADELLLAIPSATSELVRRVAELAESAGVALKVVPSVQEIIGGHVTARDIRDLRIEDLLGRQQVEIDLGAVADILRGRRVLVTGAGGSIGSEIARQVAAFLPASLVLLEHDETHLHDVTREIGAHSCIDVLADIRDPDRMYEIFHRYRPEVVFHAAAHKHVPILETYPKEAVLTNIIGTANVVDAAVAAGVSRFVLVSTDKAVRPASVMGSTKWFAEQIVRSVQAPGRDFCAVRFGNVLGSRGSVVPVFLDQIQRGGPVTVTDPAMSRYFMSIPEAVRLVLQAAALSKGGEVLTLDMGEPVNILELARKLIRLSGHVPGRDIPIEIVGIRPGEKVVEDIEDPTEEHVPTAHPGVVVSRPCVPDNPALRHGIQELEALMAEGDDEMLAARLRSMVSGELSLLDAGGLV